jgi:valyl-tRNA synthetase
MMMGEYFKKELPFEDIYMHALVRDEHGAKMSKSKGNVIDPLDMVEKHSADIIRFTLCFLAVQGRDIKLGEKNLEQFRNFTNKLYNASNFLQLNVKTFPNLEEIDIKTPLGLYMQTRLSVAVDELRDAIDNYKFNESASILYRFVWNEFCDWGIEYSKADKNSIVELGAIFKETLKLVSPFMPFIADYLYHKLSGTNLEDENEKSLMVMKFPKDIKKDTKSQELFDIISEAITTIRRAKVVVDMGNSKIQKAYIKLDNSIYDKINKNIAKPFIQKLAKVQTIEFVTEKIPNSIVDVSHNLEVYLPTDNIDMSKIKEKLQNQKDKLQKEMDKLNGMLSNEKFIKNAPQNIIDANKKNLEDTKNKLQKVQKEIDEKDF